MKFTINKDVFIKELSKVQGVGEKRQTMLILSNLLMTAEKGKISLLATNLEVGVKTFTIHKLVASNYIDNQYNKPQVNHIDGNKSNNHVSNLEWVTQSENIRHAINTGLKSTFVHENARISCSKKLMDIETKTIYNSISEACRYFNMPFTTFKRYINKSNRFQII